MSKVYKRNLKQTLKEQKKFFKVALRNGIYNIDRPNESGDVMRILLVEDELHLSEAIVHLLKQQNYIVDANLDGEEGYFSILTDVYDCVILDVMLPSMNGFDILEKVREEGIETPIIMLTARGQIEDKLEGLNGGADDYLAKPFNMEELIARIRVLTRRKGKAIESDIITIGDLSYDKDKMKLFTSDKEVTLTQLENELFLLLMDRKNMQTSKEQIIVKLWGYDSEAIDNNVEVYISFLRKKIKHLSKEVIIKTTRGVGYRLEETNV